MLNDLMCFCFFERLCIDKRLFKPLLLWIISPTVHNYSGSLGVVAGWGRTAEKGDPSDYLQEIHVGTRACYGIGRGTYAYTCTIKDIYWYMYRYTNVLVLYYRDRNNRITHLLFLLPTIGLSNRMSSSSIFNKHSKYRWLFSGINTYVYIRSLIRIVLSYLNISYTKKE